MRRLLSRLPDGRAIASARAGDTTAAIVDLLEGGPSNDNAVRWVSVGSGECIPASRLMVQLACGFARSRQAGAPLTGRGAVSRDEPRRPRRGIRRRADRRN
jgi:hypothetical protein